MGGTTVSIRVMSIGFRSPEARAFESFVEQQPDMKMVGACNELQNVANVAWKCVPHVMLMYLRGTQLAVSAVRDVLAVMSDARLLLIVPVCPMSRAVEIIEAGAWGVLDFTELGKQGPRAIRAIRSGEIWGSHKVLSEIVRGTVHHTSRQITQSKFSHDLTGREGEIIKLVQTGSSNKEIAARLEISDKTVKAHLHNIFAKLKVHSRNKIFPKLFS